MNMKRLSFLGLWAIAGLMLTACNLNAVRGSGDLVSESRPVGDFSRVRLGGSGELIIIQSGEEGLVVETDDNIMEYVTAEVRGETLELGLDGARFSAFSPTRLTFTLDVDDLEGLGISGSGDAEADGIETDRLNITVSGSGNVQIGNLTASTVEVTISGSGNVELAGEATAQEIEIGGSGTYRARNLRTESATVDIGGSGDATLRVTESLDASISGSGSVDYYGNPTVNSSVSGSGTINSRGGG